MLTLVHNEVIIIEDQYMYHVVNSRVPFKTLSDIPFREYISHVKFGILETQILYDVIKQTKKEFTLIKNYFKFCFL